LFYILLLIIIIVSIYSGILICDPESVRRKDVSFLFISAGAVFGFARLLKFDHIAGYASANLIVGIFLMIQRILKRKGKI